MRLDHDGILAPAAVCSSGERRRNGKFPTNRARPPSMLSTGLLAARNCTVARCAVVRMIGGH
jgi:hypothetical protein